MNVKPYIEYKDEIYEFEANNSLKRAYERDRKKLTVKYFANANLSEADIKNLDELQKLISEKEDITFNDLDDKTKAKLSKSYDVLIDFDLSASGIGVLTVFVPVEIYKILPVESDVYFSIKLLYASSFAFLKAVTVCVVVTSAESL